MLAGLWKSPHIHATTHSRRAERPGGPLQPAARRAGRRDQEAAAEAAGLPAGTETQLAKSLTLTGLPAGFTWMLTAFLVCLLQGLRKIWYQLASETSRVPAVMENSLIRSHKQRLEEKLLWVEKSIAYTRKCLEKLK